MTIIQPLNKNYPSLKYSEDDQDKELTALSGFAGEKANFNATDLK